MSTEEIIRILEEFQDYFETNNIVGTVFRWIGWAVAKGMASLAEQCANLYDYAFGLVDITTWGPFQDFLEDFRPLVSAVVFLSLIVLAYIFLFGKEKKRPVLSSLLILAAVMLSSNYIFATLNQGARLFKGAVAGSATNNAYEVIRDNVYDLCYIDQEIGLANLEEGSIPRNNELSAEDIKLLDADEVVNYSSSLLTTSEAEDILKQRLVTRPDGEKILQEVSNGIGWNSEDDTDFLNEFYFRYTIHFGSIFITLLALMIVYILLAYKCIRIIWELFTGRILTVIFAGDLSGNQKMVRILYAIRDGYYALCFTAVTLKCFLLFQSYLQTRTEISGFAKGLLLLFIAWCTVDGANILEKITGIDAGLSGGAGKLLSVYHLARGAAGVGMGAAGMMRQHQMIQQMKAQTAALQNMAQGGTPPGSPKAGPGAGSGQGQMDPSAAPGGPDPSGSQPGDGQEPADPGGTAGDTQSADTGQTGGDMQNMTPEQGSGYGTGQGPDESQGTGSSDGSQDGGAGMANLEPDGEGSPQTNGGAEDARPDRYEAADRNDGERKKETPGSSASTEESPRESAPEPYQEAGHGYGPQPANLYEKYEAKAASHQDVPETAGKEERADWHENTSSQKK